MTKTLVVPLFASFLLLPAAVSATCTVQLDCQNGCSVDKTCPAPYQWCELSCLVYSQTLSCTGSTECLAGTSSISCDGVVQTCKTNRCSQTNLSIRCDSTVRYCDPSCPR